jgi:hypothetical protein
MNKKLKCLINKQIKTLNFEMLKQQIKDDNSKRNIQIASERTDGNNEEMYFSDTTAASERVQTSMFKIEVVEVRNLPKPSQNIDSELFHPSSTKQNWNCVIDMLNNKFNFKVVSSTCINIRMNKVHQTLSNSYFLKEK